MENEIIDFNKREGIVSFYENASLVKSIGLNFFSTKFYFPWSHFLKAAKNVSIMYFYLEIEEILLSLLKYAFERLIIVID